MQRYQRIRDLREDSDLTQQQLCEKLCMHKTTYVNYEQGKRNIPFELAVTLADFYHVSLDYLAGRTNIKQKFVSDKVKALNSQLGKIKNEPLNPNELKLIKQYRTLNKRNQDRLEDFLEILEETQKK